ncbi:MAG: cytochrome c peroxidase [Alphaproteobacteria bacterium]
MAVALIAVAALLARAPDAYAGALPASTDLTRDRVSAHGLYRVAISSRQDPVPLGRMHRWEVRVAAPSGAPVEDARIAISGAMPDQNHLMPTAPRVTRALGDGRYLIEGVKFDRQGWWHLRLAIGAEAGRDIATFSVMVGTLAWAEWSDDWSADERAVLRSLWIGSLAAPPPDPSNAVGDSIAAAELGHRLFFDRRLSANETVACANCHIPGLAFTDGRRLAQGVGQTTRNAPTIVGAAYSPFLFWDGRTDSLWSQALDPFEARAEHGTIRAKILAVVEGEPDYRRRYTALFGPLPGYGDEPGAARAFTNLGKAIAAYERLLLPGPSRFDRYVEAVLDNREPAEGDRLSVDEHAGLKIFISANQGQCIRCHNGPMFTDHEFHNIGSQVPGAAPTERGRALGIAAALADEHNCLGRHSDAPDKACAELRFAKRRGAELEGAFKTPTLRFLPKTAPYMHAGQIETLNDVLWLYRDRPRATVGVTELEPLTMSDAGFRQIEAFLGTLDGPVRAPRRFLGPPD